MARRTKGGKKGRSKAGSQKKPGRRAPPKAPPPGRGHPNHGKLPRTGYDLAEALGRIAVRTIYAGVTHNPAVIKRMKEAGKYTKDFERFESKKYPKEVEDWVRDNFWKLEKPVMRAVVSELGLGLWHALPARGDGPGKIFECAPGHLKPSNRDDDFNPDAPEQRNRQSSPPPLTCCTPWCGGG